MRKILFIGDGVAPTGFARVVHSIIKFLPENKYDIAHLAVNYLGDPHTFKHRIYPAGIKGDSYGMNRLEEILGTERPELVFILNDAWLIDTYLYNMKMIYKGKNLPKIVAYFPVDGKEHDPNWYANFDIVNQAVVYTKFGYDVVKKAVPDLNLLIIPHGIDPTSFYKLPGTKEEIKRKLYGSRQDYIDSFIVLNANRNQPRKRLDITAEAFSLFAKDKPDNVKMYFHCGLIDSSMDIVKMAIRYNIDKKMVITQGGIGNQNVSVQRLNLIYNATDVGINTSLGEGWGLCNVEQAVSGKPQVVPAHSACKELFKDNGLLVKPYAKWTIDKINTVGEIVRAEDVAKQLQKLYEDKELYDSLSKKTQEKFTDKKYSWEEISKNWDKVFEEVLDGDSLA